VSAQRRLRRRHRQRWLPIEEARLWISVFADGYSTREAAHLHGLHGATDYKTARDKVARARETKIPELAQHLRAEDPSARVDALAERLLAEIESGRAGQLLTGITAAELRELEERGQRYTRALAQHWGCDPDEVRARIVAEYGEPPAAVALDDRSEAAALYFMRLLTLESQGEQGGGVPPLPVYLYRDAHTKFTTRYAPTEERRSR
jgi:transposase